MTISINSGAYDLYSIITEIYPRRAFLHPEEVAELLGVNVKTVREAIKRKYNPLPARDVSKGTKNKYYVIPITELCKWGTGRRV